VGVGVLVWVGVGVLVSVGVGVLAVEKPSTLAKLLDHVVSATERVGFTAI
jgi:hypothetical protein